METRGRNKGLTLNGLFWRYLLTTAAWSAALCLAALYLVQLLVLLGVILPAGAGEWSLDQTAAALQAQETFAPEEIPFFYQYALVEDGTLLETNMTEQEQVWARQVLAGDTARHGFPYTKYYRTVPLADGRRCLLQYDYAVRYTDPVLREALPDFQLTTLLLLAALLLLVALRRTRRYARLLRRDAQAITAACQGVARQDLEAPFPQTAQVQELQAALAALDTLRQELSRSLQEQWAGEQQKDALLAALAHDLKTPSPSSAATPSCWRKIPSPPPRMPVCRLSSGGRRPPRTMWPGFKPLPPAAWSRRRISLSLSRRWRRSWRPCAGICPLPRACRSPGRRSLPPCRRAPSPGRGTR